MAGPAAANLFWDFSFTAVITDSGGAGVDVTGTYEIGGSTGDDSTGLVTVPNSSVSLLSAPGSLIAQNISYTMFGTTFNSNNDYSFDFAQNNGTADVTWAGDRSQGFAFSLDFSGTTVYFLAVGEWPERQGVPTTSPVLRWTTQTTDQIPQFGAQLNPSNNPYGGYTELVGSASLVPEINGSGFAYIAFILGALGLWLYSGAGRTRQEETPAVA